MIKLDLHEGSYFSVCKHYKHIYETPRIKNNPDLMKEAMKNVVIYLLLSPFGNEQQDLLHRLSEDKNLQQLPKYR
jgi:26S proteasome regulatory subunit N5